MIQVFFSYTRADDDHHQGALSSLRNLLEQELAIQSGERCQVFQDTKDIKPGERWKERLREGVSEALFFVPIVTPSYLRSRPCREEIGEFAALSDARDLTDRIIPFLFIDVPAIHDVAKVRRSWLLSLLTSHQWIDMRDKRFADVTDPDVRGLVASVASRIVSSHGRRTRRAPDGQRAAPHRGNRRMSEHEVPLVGDEQPAAESSMALTTHLEWTPRTGSVLTVDPDGRADFESLDDALRSAAAGNRIRLAPGVYRNEYPVRKPVIIEGVVPGEAVIEAFSGPALRVEAPAVFLKSLVIRRRRTEVPEGAEPKETAHFSLFVSGGHVVVVDCEISSESLSGIGVAASSRVSVVATRVLNCAQSGIYCYRSGRVEVTDCELSHNSFQGLAVDEQGTAVVRLSRLESNGRHGASATGASDITLEGCVIRDNEVDGVDFSSTGGMQVKACRIEANQRHGVYMHSGASSVVVVTDSDILRNRRTALVVSEQTNPSVFASSIGRSLEGSAVFVYGEGQGRFHYNRLFGDDGHRYAAVECAGHARCTLASNQIVGGTGSGVYVREQGRAELLFNEIADHAQSGIFCTADGTVEGANNRIVRNRGYGIRITANGRVNVRATEFVDNGLGEILDEASKDGALEAGSDGGAATDDNSDESTSGDTV